ncbi:Glucose/ribitol dehydrogenase [Penicillium cf. griseofulvum]|nr:Glucose/ribitol dehydrogenase [Penicillium cf. griseofulvum]
MPVPRISAYSAAKAALNAFKLCLRNQLRNQTLKSPIVEWRMKSIMRIMLHIAELHDYMGVEKGRGMGMPVEEYAEDAYQALEKGSDEPRRSFRI